MTAPVRIQRRRTAGWRMPDGARYVGRGTRYGNPFRVQRVPNWPKWAIGRAPWQVVDDHGRVWEDQRVDRTVVVGRDAADVHRRRRALEWAIELYELHAGPMGNYELDADALAELQGRDLACWCPIDEPCHADVLLRLANPELEATR